ncbi:hypothetical protein CHELA1G11_12720 [Hyphomicrobiales bacterium]|nr:hypothetical protein CHELA1G2_11586 [Hyphomicrobiales bacterium]CAH1666653.1 hypothetical protein CHELA1G11_12720 [Hyphomicrobiales bacterium]
MILTVVQMVLLSLCSDSHLWTQEPLGNRARPDRARHAAAEKCAGVSGVNVDISTPEVS